VRRKPRGLPEQVFMKNGDFDEYKLKKGTKNRPGTSAAETG